MEHSNLWETTSVYKAQCKTFAIAQEITGIRGNASDMTTIYDAPFCIRILKEYRTKVMTQFRNEVAKKTWEIREKGRGGRNDCL